MKCTKCGECCSAFLPLTGKDISNIQDYIKAHNIRSVRHVPDKYVDGICPFLNDKKLCNIYEARPYICRVFKCDRKNMSKKELKTFKDNAFILSNLWSEFFDDNRGDAVVHKVRRLLMYDMRRSY